MQMELTAFQVNNYRCIDNSGWIKVDDICCIVGKNESGKTSLLHALWKFNPFRKHPYSLDREWPRGRRKERDKEAIVVACDFAFNDEELSQLQAINESCQSIESVRITKKYNGGYDYSFLPEPPSETHPIAWVVSVLEKHIGDPDPVASDHFKQQYVEALKALITDVRENGGSEHAVSTLPTFKERLPSYISQNNAEHGNDNKTIAALQQAVDQAIEQLKVDPPSRRAVDTVHEWLPTFIYMDDYRAFAGRAQLSEVQGRIKKSQATNDDETIVLIMEQAGLDLDEEVEKGNNEDKEQRMLDMNDASLTLTSELSNRWSQKKYEVKFDADGQHLVMFVKDVERQALVPLEERSKGFQWFFSFDMMFMAETDGQFQNAVILLDEPGLHLHASAQRDLLKRMEAYAEKNQLIYSTHLPFMVDSTRLDKLYICEESESGSLTHQNWQIADKDARFTLQAALGLTWSQSLFVGQYNLVVEGVTDFWYLSAFSNLFSEAGEAGLDDELVITPAGGASKVAYVGTVLRGQKLDVCVLLDSDTGGDNAYEQLVHQWILEDKLALRLGTILSSKDPIEIEDLFDKGFYREQAQLAYAKELGRKKISLSADDSRPIVDQVEAALVDKGIPHFNKGRVAKRILREAAEKSLADYDAVTVSRFKLVIAAFNDIVASWKSSK